MAVSEWEQELKKADSLHPEMSPLVRKRLDETYDLIARQAGHAPLRKTRLRRWSYTAAAAGVLGIGLFASAFVSPAMADSIKNLPIISSLFSTIQGDIGLRTAGELGMTANVNSLAAYEKVKLKVSETIYDGTRAAFLLTVDAPNLNEGIYFNGKKKMKLSSAVEQAVLTANGKGTGEWNSLTDAGLFYGGAGKSQPNTLVFEQILPESGSHEAPAAFNATVTLKLDGMDHEFTLDIPFHKTTNTGAEFSPNLETASDDYTMTVTKVSVTPVTTRVMTTLAYKHSDTLSAKEERRMTRIGIAVFDDQGRRLPSLNGEGSFKGNTLTFDRRYATTSATSKYLIIKPFVIKDDFTEEVKDSQYIQELEAKVELPPAIK